MLNSLPSQQRSDRRKDRDLDFDDRIMNTYKFLRSKIGE